jgi:site-specific recombinase XerD
VQRYLGQMAVTLRPTSLPKEEAKLRRFFSWLAQAEPQVTRINHIQRHHIEDFKEHLRWAPLHPRFHCPPGATLKPSTIAHTLYSLSNFFSRISEWGWSEAPARPLVFAGDFPRPEQPLPRFLEEPEAARFLQAARTHPDPFTRVCGVTLLRTGLRKGELLSLTRDCIVQIGESHWLRVPLGKLHKERFVPLHSEVKQLLEEWTSQHLNGSPPGPHDLLFTRHGRPIGAGRVNLAVQRIAEAAGITTRVTPYRLRHTLATMAINHGMSLEGIAALLGHRSLSMTLVYARLSNRTLQKQYSAVSGQLEQLCGSPSWAPPGSKQALSDASSTEGHQTPHRVPKAHWTMLGNGYCARPQDMPCEYESICESCPGFQTTADFLPHLRQQREDAESKGQFQRASLIAKLIHRLEALP